MSPTPASGNLLRCEPNPYGSIRKSDFAPLLSAQLRTAPTGRPSVRRYFLPVAPPAMRVDERGDYYWTFLNPTYRPFPYLPDDANDVEELVMCEWIGALVLTIKV